MNYYEGEENEEFLIASRHLYLSACRHCLNTVASWCHLLVKPMIDTLLLVNTVSCCVVCSTIEGHTLTLTPRIMIEYQRRPTKFTADAETAEPSGSVLCCIYFRSSAYIFASLWHFLQRGSIACYAKHCINSVRPSVTRWYQAKTT